MVERHFPLTKDKIRPLASGHGGCFATNRIVMDGAPVGHMYREAPDFEIDSGWRFFAGDESEEYTNVSDNIRLYDVNTIANYDPEIIPLLEEPPGSAFHRDPETGEFVAMP